MAPPQRITGLTTATALLVLTGLGAPAPRDGGASKRRGAARMLVWGALVMGATAAAGRLFGAII